MRRREKNNAKFVVVLILCIILAAMVIGEGLVFLKMNQNYTQMKNANEANIQELKTQIDEKNAEISKLQKKVKQLKKQSENTGTQSEVQGPRIQQKVGEQNAEVEKSEEQTGISSPSDIDSVFSDSAANMTELTPGTIVNTEEAIQNMDNYFTASAIERDGSVFKRINGRSYKDNNDISLEDLRYLKLIHYNFNHQVQVGEMIVNVGIQDDVINIFKELFQKEYEIQSVYLVDNYWVDGGDGSDADTASIEQNNTSCFCYRPTTGSSTISNHGYGRAIDINPQQNPYVYSGNYSHSNAAPYIDRNCGDPHVIVGNDSDICYSTFTKYGFSWGGNWTDPVDYQHFQKAQ